MDPVGEKCGVDRGQGRGIWREAPAGRAESPWKPPSRLPSDIDSDSDEDDEDAAEEPEPESGDRGGDSGPEAEAAEEQGPPPQAWPGSEETQQAD